MDKVGPTGLRVGRRLNELRRARGYTLAELAARLEELGRPILLSALSKIEKGQRRVDADDLVALARALDVSPNSLLLPDPTETDESVELTPKTTLDTGTAWRWAVQDRPAVRPREYPKPGVPAVPAHRTIMAVDMEGSAGRTNVEMVTFRRVLFDLLETALKISGIPESARDPIEDHGDGALVLVHPLDKVPKTLLLTTLVPTLSQLLVEYNNAAQPEYRLRLRAVVHAGEVHYDNRGVFGESVVASFRLLDAPELKSALARSHSVLALVVSDAIYQTVVRHQYEGIDAAAFSQVVTGRVAGRSLRGWVRTH